MEKVQDAQAETTRAINGWYDTVEKTLTQLCDAKTTFRTGDIGVKRLILSAIGRNAVLTDKKISLEPHYWVEPIANFNKTTTEESGVVRTLDLQGSDGQKQAKFAQWCGYGESDSILVLGKHA